ncbi:hypothetical protein JCM19239_1589 [Vibrio variabilis]|uniref:Uncharacterized protein n=1 Tax=Vibrio variabilis TaxID=990271 RepID=A0ABQ0JIF5_9VIBR|nr:hypothetical protein JCM19239_1589 [Vibrio variabilis]
MKEDIKDEPNHHMKEGFIIQLLQHSNHQTLWLHQYLGMRPLSLPTPTWKRIRMRTLKPYI